MTKKNLQENSPELKDDGNSPKIIEENDRFSEDGTNSSYTEEVDEVQLEGRIVDIQETLRSLVEELAGNRQQNASLRKEIGEVREEFEKVKHTLSDILIEQSKNFKKGLLNKENAWFASTAGAFLMMLGALFNWGASIKNSGPVTCKPFDPQEEKESIINGEAIIFFITLGVTVFFSLLSIPQCISSVGKRAKSLERDPSIDSQSSTYDASEGNNIACRKLSPKFPSSHLGTSSAYPSNTFPVFSNSFSGTSFKPISAANSKDSLSKPFSYAPTHDEESGRLDLRCSKCSGPSGLSRPSSPASYV